MFYSILGIPYRLVNSAQGWILRKDAFQLGLFGEPVPLTPKKKALKPKAKTKTDKQGRTWVRSDETGRFRLARPGEVTEQAATMAGLPVIKEDVAVGGDRLEGLKRGAEVHRVYHATSSQEFDRFDPGKKGSATDEGLLGSGFYFSTDPNIAKKGQRTATVDVSLINPLRLSAPSWVSNKPELVNEAIGTKGLVGQALTDTLIQQGYDGVILDYSPLGYQHQEIAVFNPEQAKIQGFSGVETRDRDKRSTPSANLPRGLASDNSPKESDRTTKISNFESPEAKAITDKAIKLNPSELKRGQQVKFMQWGTSNEHGVVPVYEHEFVVTNVSPSHVNVKALHPNAGGTRVSRKLGRSNSGSMFDGEFYPIDSQPLIAHALSRGRQAELKVDSLRSEVEQKRAAFDQDKSKDNHSDLVNTGSLLRAAEKELEIGLKTLEGLKGEGVEVPVGDRFSASINDIENKTYSQVSRRFSDRKPESRLEIQDNIEGKLSRLHEQLQSDAHAAVTGKNSIGGKLPESLRIAASKRAQNLISEMVAIHDHFAPDGLLESDNRNHFWLRSLASNIETLRNGLMGYASNRYPERKRFPSYLLNDGELMTGDRPAKVSNFESPESGLNPRTGLPNDDDVDPSDRPVLALIGATAKEGDRKTINGRTYELRGGRWHRVDEEATLVPRSRSENNATQVRDPIGSGERIGNDAGDDTGASDGIGDRRDAGTISPRLVTARPDLTASADPARIPERLHEHLREHQLQGAALATQAMDSQGGFLLADGTGAGKSRQILAIAQTYAEQGKKVLIVAPSQVIKQNWKKGTFEGSYAKDGAAMGVDVSLTRDGDSIKAGSIAISTYDSLTKLKGAVDKDTVLIFDEAHYMKNVDSARTKHGIEMMKNAHSVCYATATPADKPEHIPYLFRSGIFKGNKKEEIYEWMGLRSREINVPGGKTIKVWEIPKGKAAQVHHRMQGLFDDLTERGLMVQRGISMEGVNVEFQSIPVPPEAQEMLSNIAKAYSNGENGGLEKAQMLMQQRRQLEPYKIPGAVAEVQKELEAGRQVIVFVSRVSESEVTERDPLIPMGDVGMMRASSWNEDGKPKVIASSEGAAGTLKQALLDAGIADVTELHGAADTKATQAMGDFQSGKAKVIIATIESGGTGVNLDDTTGDSPRTMIMLTPPFSAVENIQAAGRVWRMTTKSYPTMRYLFTDTPVDEWNREIIANKMAAVGAAVPGIETLDLPSDISDAGLEAFLEAKKQGVSPSGVAPRPPEAPKGPPTGFRVNQYAGYAPDGTKVDAGEGYIRKENGSWVTYAKDHVNDRGEVVLKLPEKPKPISMGDRQRKAQDVINQISQPGNGVEPKIWTGGNNVRVYLNKPGRRDSYGYLEVTPEGRIRNQTTLRPDHPLLESLGDDLMKAAKLRPKKRRKKPASDPCWEGYEAVGTKRKGKKAVPNCVPMKKFAFNGVYYQASVVDGAIALVR